MAAPPSAKSQAAAPEADAAGAGGKKKSKKMLFIVIGVVIALIAGGAGAWFFLMKKPKDGEAAEAEVETHAKAPALVFVPLEAFTVNLADTDSERFAQIAVTLQVADDKTGEEVKKVMPLVRHGILLTIARKTSKEILTHEGKVELAEEIARETGRAIGWKPPKKPKKKVAKSEDGEEEEEEEPPKKSKAKPNPIEQVQFSQFIVQ